MPYLRQLFRDLYAQQNCANRGKRWDWENLDTDNLGTATVDLQDGVEPQFRAPNGVDPLRPNTAAAIGNPREVVNLVDDDENSRQAVALEDGQQVDDSLVMRVFGSGGLLSTPFGTPGNGLTDYGAAAFSAPSSAAQKRPHTAQATNGSSYVPTVYNSTAPATGGLKSAATSSAAMDVEEVYSKIVLL